MSQTIITTISYLGLPAPDLHSVLTQLETRDAVGRVGGAQLREDEGPLPAYLAHRDQVGRRAAHGGDGRRGSSRGGLDQHLIFTQEVHRALLG